MSTPACRRKDAAIAGMCPETVGAGEPCESDSVCSAGTECSGARVLCDGGRLDEEAACRVPTRDPEDGDALLRGFMVDSFQLLPTSRSQGNETPPNAFTWSSLPDKTRAVKCAVFACSPVLRQVGSYQDFPVVDIVNYSQCAVEEHLFEPPSGTYAVGLEETPDPDCEHLQPVSAQSLTTLKLACWSYDGSRVTGATSMIALRDTQAFALTRLVDRDCSAGAGRACDLGEQWGICIGKSKCRARCTDDRDCRAVAAEVRARPIDPSDGGLLSRTLAPCGTNLVCSPKWGACMTVSESEGLD